MDNQTQTTEAIKISARGSKDECHALVAAFDADIRTEDLTHSLMIGHDTGEWRVECYPTDDQISPVQNIIDEHPNLTMTREVLADQDWVALSLSGLPPVRAGRFFVYGAHDKGRVPDHTINLAIDAGLAFGTGHHGTTEGCLSAFDHLLKSRTFPRVLDVGTGTGVLGIAAKRTGSDVVVGTDMDADSVRVAQDNARLNGAPFPTVQDSALTHTAVQKSAPYDLVFANILAPPLVALAPKITALTKPGGIIILSGLLDTQQQRIVAAYGRLGAKLLQVVKRDAWRTLVLQA